MSIVFKSLVGTLAVASTLAGTVGTTLFVWRSVDFAIHDAVARQLAEMQSEEVMYHSGIDRLDADPAACPAFEGMNQPAEGALMDSRIVAVLIDELAGASPQEREAWTQMLRRPDSHESYRCLFAFYHGKARQNGERTSEQVPAAAVIQRASMPPSPSLPGDETCESDNSTATLGSAFEALRTARQVLLQKALNEELSALCERYDQLLESRLQSQQLRDAPVDSTNSPAQLPE